MLKLEMEHHRKKKRDSKNGHLFRKTWFFEITGKYVKGEDKEGTEKGSSNQRESSKKKEMHSKRTQKRNQGKTDIRENKKMKMSKNRQEVTQKRKQFLVKGIEKRQTCSKPKNL